MDNTTQLECTGDHERMGNAGFSGCAYCGGDLISKTNATQELLAAANCAANVIFLLSDEVSRLGLGAAKVGPKLRAAVIKMESLNGRKREIDGRYAYDGNLDRLCVCGHTLGNHSCGSAADCILYSLPTIEQRSYPGADKPNCGCMKFRLSRKGKHGGD